MICARFTFSNTFVPQKSENPANDEELLGIWSLGISGVQVFAVFLGASDVRINRRLRHHCTVLFDNRVHGQSPHSRTGTSFAKRRWIVLCCDFSSESTGVVSSFGVANTHLPHACG